MMYFKLPHYLAIQSGFQVTNVEIGLWKHALELSQLSECTHYTHIGVWLALSSTFLPK